MIRARAFASLTIVLVAFSVSPLSSAGESGFDGVYIAHGVDSDGNEYRRAVDIERRGEQFIVTWVSARVAGETVVLEATWVGVGLATSETLSVSFIAGDSLGIAVYQVAAQGRQLSGRWTLAGDDEAVHAETLTRLPERLSEPLLTSESSPTMSASTAGSSRRRQMCESVALAECGAPHNADRELHTR
jgi:hypothetical protein